MASRRVPSTVITPRARCFCLQSLGAPGPCERTLLRPVIFPRHPPLSNQEPQPDRRAGPSRRRETMATDVMQQTPPLPETIETRVMEGEVIRPGQEVYLSFQEDDQLNIATV